MDIDTTLWIITCLHKENLALEQQGMIYFMADRIHDSVDN